MARKVTANMWVRRVISTALLLGLLVAIIFGVVKGYGAIHARLSDHQDKVAVETGNVPVSISECRFGDLDVHLDPEPVTAPVGEGFKLKISVKNTGLEECSLHTERLQIEMLTGDHAVWSPTECSQSWQRQLLLPANGTWEVSRTWDGNIYEGCDAATRGDEERPLVADDGTYLLQARLLGRQVTPETPVVVSY